MDDTTMERVLDARVQRRLRSDRAYRNAENSEEQAAREDAIEQEEYARLMFELKQREMEEAHAEGLHDELPREFCPLCEQRTG